jgi:hypothetical protein
MKGWLDNFGKADNANNSNVSMSEDFVGLGYNTKGRNYSPAWGGQFEQGGIIPIAQNGVSEYMEKKKWEEKDKNIAKTYDLPEVVVSAPIMTEYNDPDKLTGYPQYIPKPGDNVNIPGWDIAEFYKSWVSSPEYERRMKNTGYYENVPGGAIYRKEGSTIYPQMGEWLSNARESRMGALESVQEPGFIQIEPSYYKGMPASRYTGLGIDIHPDHTKTPEMFETVLAHEIGHAIDSTTPFEDSLITSTMLPFSEFNKSFYTIDPVTGNYQPINQKDDIRRSQALHIRNDPQEFKSDLNALRYLMFDKGVYDIRKGKEFTKEDLERAKEKLKGNASLDRTIQAAGESGLIKLMNIIAKGKEDVTPVAMNGTSMPGAVGFTYARVAGAAPSKGKYAKKTMASAQNGIIADKIAGLELKMSPEYQRLKYLQSLPQLRQAPGRGEELVREGLATADIATDLMQIGNFIPHPMAQGVGKAGNILGSGVDLAQALMSARQGNYLDAAINLGSVGLAGGLASSTFRRNSKYLQPGQPLYALSPQAFGSLSRTNYIEPFRKVGKMTDKNLLANRALLGLIGAETVYDAIPQKEYGGDIPSAQNGQEMRFYQNGLDWKPKSMQNGGEEMYEGRLLPEVVVTPYDEQYPFYQSLSEEEKKYLNDKGPIGRGIRAIATTGKRGQTAQDISTGVEDTYRFLADYTGIPGTIRFAKDPINKLKSFERSLFNTAVSSSPFLPTTPYDPKDIQGTFDVLDATGVATAIASPLIRPAGAAVRMAGKAVVPHMMSVSNVANETLDAIKEINRLKQFEKIATADVPLVQGVDKVKDIRNFGRDIFDLGSQVRSAKQGEVDALLERLVKLEENAKQLEAAGFKPYTGDLNSISSKLNDLKGYKHDEFIKKVKSLGADEDTIRILENDPDLAAHYARQTSNYNDAAMIDELNNRSLLRGVQDSFAYNKGKSSTFSPKPTTVGTINNINPVTGETLWRSTENPLKKVGNKIYVDSGGWGNDEFYSYPFYKNVGDKITDLYANLRLSNSPIVPNVENQFDAIELIPNLSASKHNVGSILRQASRYIDETPDGLFIPAGSLSGDSYPLSLQMMARELKNNPDSKLRLLGFQETNRLGFADEMDNPKVLASELSQILKDLEKTTGQTLPSPFVPKNPRFDETVVFPKFGVSKGKANQIIDDYMKNASIAEKVGVKRPVYEVSNIPGPPRSLWGTFQNGGQLKFNPLTNEYELPEVVVEGKDERIKNAMSQGMANFYGHLGELMSAPQKEMMQLITGKEQTPSQEWGFKNPGGWLDSPTSFGKNAFNFGMDALGDPLNAVGVGLADDVFKLSIKNVGKNLTENLGKGIGRRAVSQVPSPQMMVDDVSTQLANNSNQLGNAATQVAPPDPWKHFSTFLDKKKQIIDDLKTQEGRKRLQAYIDQNHVLSILNPNMTVDDFIRDVEQTMFEVSRPKMIFTKRPDGKTVQLPEVDAMGNVVMYPVDPNNAYNWYREGILQPAMMSIGENHTLYDALHTLEHEFAHLFQRGSEVKGVDDVLGNITLKSDAAIGKPTFTDVINRFNPFSKKVEDVGKSSDLIKIGSSENPTEAAKQLRKNNLLGSKEYFIHGFGKGMEKAAFAAEVRENLFQRGFIKNRYDEITPEMLRKHYRLYNKTGGDKFNLRMYEIMEPNKNNFSLLSQALNRMPQVALPIAGGAAAVSSALQDEQPVQKQKNGGITKDNLGYWNPDNWGKPVEIGSNNITMKGVYEPLLGISDTGDTKLMQPGKNYKFKGKKVTEFPVAELGINQLDAYPMKKLNQLLNFTNNPDKDNWLDKYN